MAAVRRAIAPREAMMTAADILHPSDQPSSSRGAGGSLDFLQSLCMHSQVLSAGMSLLRGTCPDRAALQHGYPLFTEIQSLLQSYMHVFRRMW